MARLRTYVHTKDLKGRPVVLGPDTDPLPEWAIARITNPAAWLEAPDRSPTVVEPAVVDAPAPDDVEEGEDADVAERPIDSAAKPVWAAYARSRGIDVDGLTKSAIIAAVSTVDAED